MCKAFIQPSLTPNCMSFHTPPAAPLTPLLLCPLSPTRPGLPVRLLPRPDRCHDHGGHRRAVQQHGGRALLPQGLEVPRYASTLFDLQIDLQEVDGNGAFDTSFACVVLAPPSP